MPRMDLEESSVSSMVNGDGPGSSNISLSTREIEIIELVAEGLTNQEIAERLTISKRTVDNHVSNVFTKTGLFHFVWMAARNRPAVHPSTTRDEK